MSESVNTPAQQNSIRPFHTLDERFYYLTDEESTFFKQQTGIQDDEELKAHILGVQAEAYKVCRARHDDGKALIMLILKIGSTLPLHPTLRVCKVGKI